MHTGPYFQNELENILVTWKNKLDPITDPRGARKI